jgi:hypothetical protein
VLLVLVNEATKIAEYLQLQEKERPLVEKYEKEFNEHGLDRLELRRDN